MVRKTLVESKAESKNLLAYHYCSAEAFFNILRNQKFWLSNALCTNDSTESRLYCEAIRLMLDGDETVEHLSHKVLKEVLKKQNDDKGVFIGSLSKKQDALSQWRGYAEDGRGFAIGINYKKIDHSNSEMNSFFNSLLIKDVKYSKPSTLCSEVEDASKLADKLFDLMNKDNSHNNLSYVEVLDFVLFINSLYSKHEKFSEEKEVRFCRVCQNPKGDSRRPGDKDDIEIKYRVSKKQVVPYVETELNHGCIDRIILGPNNPSSEIFIQDFLRSLSKDAEKIKIVRSKIPYISK